MTTHSDFLYVIFKPTTGCNLRCRYCYAKHSLGIASQMSLEEIITAFNWLADYALRLNMSRLTICWHGGEPFLIPLPIMEEALKVGRKIFEYKGLKSRFLVQTNGSLITSEHLPLIADYFDNHIGLSMDYKTESRVFAGGGDSSRQIIDTAKMLIANGVQCGAITMLTKLNSMLISELYDFFKSLNLPFTLNRVFPINSEGLDDSNVYLTDEEFAQAKIELFDLWFADRNKPIFLNDIIETVLDLLVGRPSMCSRNDNCQINYLSVSPGGHIFPCGEFDRPEHVLGNFLQESPDEFYEKNNRQEFFYQHPAPENCLNCQYWRVCHGGCLRERTLLGRPFMCRTTQIYYDHIKQWLKSYDLDLYCLENATAEEATATLSRHLQ